MGNRILVLARHNLTLVAREPGPMISRLVLPVIMILVLRPLYSSALGGQGRGTVQAVVGMLVMFSLLGMSVVGNAVLSERSWHTLDRLRATPAGPAELLLGKAVPVLALVLLQQLVLLVVGTAGLGLRVASPGLLAAAVLAWAVTLVCVGGAVATLVRGTAALSAAVDIGSMALTTLAGALVPAASMPGWARAAAPASPGYWALRGLRAALVGDAAGTWGSVGVLLGVAVVGASIAAVRLAHGWGRESPV